MDHASPLFSFGASPGGAVAGEEGPLVSGALLVLGLLLMGNATTSIASDRVWGGWLG